MKVLHIASWYPNYKEPKSALWIKRHIQSLDTFTENEVIHVEIKQGGFLFQQCEYSNREHGVVLHIPFFRFFIAEFLYFLLLLWLLKWRFRHLSYDLINFHIAYPLLTYFHWLRKFVPSKKFFVTEHWSAYHFDFNITRQDKLKRIKRIFKNPIHWITVSQALKEDLIQFSGLDQLPVSVVPNVVDTSLFTLSSKSNHARSGIHSFFMVGNWSWPKQSILLLQAYKRAVSKGLSITLRIGGYGKDIPAMKEFVVKNDLDNYVCLLGALNPEEIAHEMQAALAYLHCSDYETFSVVCAESLCCGTPVIASRVGGITEVVDNTSGRLIENTIDHWEDALLNFSPGEFNSEDISSRANYLFSREAVGKKYFDVLLKNS